MSQRTNITVKKNFVIKILKVLKRTYILTTHLLYTTVGNYIIISPTEQYILQWKKYTAESKAGWKFREHVIDVVIDGKSTPRNNL